VKKSWIATLAAGGSLAVAGLVGGFAVDAAAPAYPLPPTTTIAEQLPPPAPPPVTLPQTGSDGVGSTVMMGGTLAIAGLGLVLVTRRRRQQPSAS
jgi:LPXTG-motif cell wall-anchored protein